jgi:hypothetical protein
MIMNNKYYPYPNEGVMENNLQQKKDGKRSFLFYKAYNYKSYQCPSDDNPMQYVINADREHSEIVNETCYFHSDDGDVWKGELSQDWKDHKKGAIVFFPNPAINGHWVAIQENKILKTKYFFIYTATEGKFRVANGYKCYEEFCCRHSHPIMGSGKYIHRYVVHSYIREELEHDIQLAMKRRKFEKEPEIREVQFPDNGVSIRDFFRAID